MKEKILEIILNSINEINLESDIQVDTSMGIETRLYGGQGLLDSISLVSLIVCIEEKIEMEFGYQIILADEKAMSRRTSPFLSVKLLTDFILEKLESSK